jgi:hypothetical protein
MEWTRPRFRFPARRILPATVTAQRSTPAILPICRNTNTKPAAALACRPDVVLIERRGGGAMRDEDLNFRSGEKGGRRLQGNRN